MNPRRPKAQFLAALIAVVLLSWMTFDKLIGIRFTNSDDMYISTISFNNYFSLALREATAAGRINYLYAAIYDAITSIWWNSPIFDVILYGSLSAVLVLIVAFANYTGFFLSGVLFVIVYLTLIPVTFEFNPLVGYPFRYTSGMILWLLSLFCIEKYLRSRNGLFLATACATSFLAYATHETLFAIFAAVNMIFPVIRKKSATGGRKFISKAIIALATTSLIYGVMFVSWYLTHPTQYAGNTADFSKSNGILDWASTTSYFVKASLPLFHPLHGYALPFIEGETGLYSAISVSTDFPSILANLDAGQLFRCLIVMTLTLIAACRLPLHVDRAAIKWITLAAGAVLVLPAAIVSLSPAYQGYVQGGWAPLHTTFFSFFGAVALICAAITVALKAASPRLRQIMSCGFALLIGAGALVMDNFNAQVAEAMRVNTQRWNAVATLIRYSSRAEMPNVIVAPQLWNYAGNPGPLPEDYWQKLFRVKTDVNVEFQPVAGGNAADSADMYYDCQTQTECVILLQRGHTDPIQVISTSPRARFLKYGTSEGSQTIKVALSLEKPPSFLSPAIFTGATPSLPVPVSMVKIL